MRQKNTFDIGPQSVNYVEEDTILLCCEASFPVSGFVAVQFIARDPTQRMTEMVAMRWGLPTFVGGKFILQPFSICPWCKRALPAIIITPTRSVIN